MSFESGWDFGDHLEDLMYCDSKWDSIKMIFITIVFYPILIFFYLPLSFLVSGIIGFISSGNGRECDKCGKKSLFNVRSSNKFWWFCKSCTKKHSKLIDDFIDGLSDKTQPKKERKS